MKEGGEETEGRGGMKCGSKNNKALEEDTPKWQGGCGCNQQSGSGGQAVVRGEVVHIDLPCAACVLPPKPKSEGTRRKEGGRRQEGQGGEERDPLKRSINAGPKRGELEAMDAEG